MRSAKLSLALLIALGCSKGGESANGDAGVKEEDCRGPGNYQAGKEGSYRPCCEGLTEQSQELPATDQRGERVCIQPPLRVYACVEGSCGDGRCEPEEEVPCGCAEDCPDAVLPGAG